MRPILKGSTDQSVIIRIVDSTDGSPETGVVFNTSGIDLWYRREGATKTSITEATLSALNDAHSDGGILHVGDGYYRLDLPDAAVASGADGVMVGGTVTGMVVIGCYVPLVAVNLQDTVRMGLTALPNAAAEAAGGLYTRGTGAGQINQPANGMVDVNGVRHLGTAYASPNTAGVPIVDTRFTNRINTAQAGASGSITLDSGASATDNLYKGASVLIIAGTGAGQASRRIYGYTGSTKVALVTPAWATNPSSDSVFVLLPGDGVIPVARNVARNVMFFMTDSTNHNPATGATVTCTRSIDGAAFGSGTLGSVVEIANGWYYVPFAAADMNGIDSVILKATATGCDQVTVELNPS